MSTATDDERLSERSIDPKDGQSMNTGGEKKNLTINVNKIKNFKKEKIRT